jgi:cytochrome oxidase Cu insertion factor (SCO1/SenC/PrrC family)
MGNGLSRNNPTIVAAFHRDLLHQGLVVLLILAAVGVAWHVLRGAQLRRAGRAGGSATTTAGSETAALPATAAPGSEAPAPAPTPPAAPATTPPAVGPEAPARRLLRIAFGLLWIFDGILQGQASMPLGMVPQAIQPTAAASPNWVQHVVNAGTTIWSYHPVGAAASVVWIQVGLGLWLLAAPRGYWSRLGGLATVGWGCLVWIFGESFGGIFAPGLTWLFGAPGAVLLYCVAGILIALPDEAWASRRLGQIILAVTGLFFIGMAVLQAWPGRGFWQGHVGRDATAGTLTAMVHDMSQTPQPHVLSTLVAAFGRLDAAHGWAVNLVAVVALAGIGAAFLSGRPRAIRVGVIAGVILALADWVLIEDLGFLGGVGTDPNSMIPMALVFTAGYVALIRVPSPAPVLVPDSPAPAGSGPIGTALPWRQRWAADPAYALRSVAALAAVAITLVGVAPMAAAAAAPNADPIINEAVNGAATLTDTAAPTFDLVDQRGQAVSLPGLRGKAIALTFLDPVCTTDCPVIAQEFRMADRILGADAGRVALVAIDANPRYIEASYLDAFDQQEGLGRVTNWLYLTGRLPELQAVWRAFGEEVDYEPAGAMIDHSEFAYVIDPAGNTREILNTDPGPATAATQSSFAVTLAGALKRALGHS